MEVTVNKPVLKTTCILLTKTYSLRPKNHVTPGFKIYPKKQIILPYLESACACKNQLMLNMGNK